MMPGSADIYGRTKDFPTHAVRRAREVFFNPFSAGFLGGYEKLLETIRFGSKIKT